MKTNTAPSIGLSPLFIYIFIDSLGINYVPNVPELC